MIAFNLNSPTHLSILLFGGTVVDTVKEPVVDEFGAPKITKTGPHQNTVKTQNVKKEVRVKGLGLKPLSDWKTKKVGIFQTNEPVLEIISQQKTHIAAEISKLILEIRGLKKQISTYYKSTLTCVDPDTLVHPHYNHTGTSTGRLSCKQPNIQNQPDKSISKVSQHFTSRFPNGKLVSADYASIEPRVEAQLSGDKQYLADIINNVDMHIKNLALAERITYEEAKQKVETDEVWKTKRKQIKGFTFVQQYGGGVVKTQAACGLMEDEVRDLVKARQNEYTRLYDWHAYCKSEVERIGEYRFFTGRIYKFKKYPAKFDWQKKKGIIESYLPTEILNYKTQGTAFDLLSIMLGKFWRERGQFNREKYLLIATVHDSVMLDSKEEYVEEAKRDLKLLDRVRPMCYTLWKYDWRVPIKIEISTGRSWYDL